MKEAVWVRPRSPAATMVLLEVAEDHGIDRTDALRGSGLTADRLIAPGAEIEAFQETTVIRNLVLLTGNRPGLGAKAGARATVAMLGAWGMAMSSSRTVRELAEIAARYGYGKFSWVFTRPYLAAHADGLHTIFDTTDVPCDIADFLIERDVAFATEVYTTFSSRELPASIRTTLTADRVATLAELFPRFAIRSGCEENAIVVPGHVVDLPLPDGNEMALRTCEHQCEQLAERFGRTRGVVAEVEALLRLGPEQPPSMTEVADTLNMHPRTLSRRLHAADTSFRALADRIRVEAATELLAGHGLTVEDTADRLGFADAASFSRAYKRWTGRTPGDARRRQPAE